MDQEEALMVSIMKRFEEEPTIHFEEVVLEDEARLISFSALKQIATELFMLHIDMTHMCPQNYETFRYMGKTVKHPRRHMAFMRDYTFSGKVHKATSAPVSLRTVVDFINYACTQHDRLRNINFNSALVNWYANGHEYIAKHSDDERDLKQPSMVATLSLGQERTLRLRRKSDNAIVRDVQLAHGSVYIMCGDQFQRNYTHEIPKVGGKKGEEMGERISVTLREHK